MGGLVPLIARIVAWAGASFVTFKVTEVVEDKLPDQENRQTAPAPQGTGFWQRFNKNWRNSLILALVSGVILYALRYLISKVVTNKKRR